jgi:UDP-GlcNAc:undecaprenyl-phosphate GlcNAc-1-phosphate transferase
MLGATVYCMNAFLLSVVLTIAMMKIAPRLGLVDVPSDRKNHEGRIPLVGAGVFLAFGISSILLRQQPPGFAAFLVAMLLIGILGAVDDIVDLRASVKFVAQCLIVGSIVLPSGFLIQNAGALFGNAPLLLGQWAIPVTIVGVVGMTNAMNLIDGLDGLAGGISFVALMWFTISAALLGLSHELAIVLVFAFSVLGFLLFNFRHPWRTRAVVFLGDAGSTMIGMGLAVVAIMLTQRSGEVLPPITALWICALPVTDTLSLIVRRLAAGKSIGANDHWHLHDLLVRTGLTVNQTVLVLIAISAVLGGIGMAGWLLHVPDRFMLISLVTPVLLHSWFSCYGWKHLHFSRRGLADSGGAVSQMTEHELAKQPIRHELGSAPTEAAS